MSYLFNPFNPAVSSSSVTSIASSAAPSYDVNSSNFVDITALATNITSMTTGISGTPVNGQAITFRIKDDGTTRNITWGASFEAKGSNLPTATTAGKVHHVRVIYNSATSKYGCVAAVVEA